MAYAYLLLIEDRNTHLPSQLQHYRHRNRHAQEYGIEKIRVLLEMRFIAVEPSSYFDKRGMKWNGKENWCLGPESQKRQMFTVRGE